MSNAAKMSAERFTILQEGYESTEHFIEEIVSVVQLKLNNHTEIVLIGSSGAHGDTKENENKIQKLLERVKSQIEQIVAKKGKPITIKLLNYGEDQNRVSFTQELPYGRSYNDCITIEMIK
jgi:mevalonate kinase